MCQLTSLAMVLASKGVKPTDPTKQLEDELYEIAKKEGRGGEKLWTPVNETYKKVLPKVSGNFSIEKGFEAFDKDFSKIKAQIDIGNPIIVDIKFNSGGHVVVCVGYTAKTLIFHDPYGNLEKGENNQYGSDENGAYVEYSYEKYELGRHWIRYLEVEE